MSRFMSISMALILTNSSDWALTWEFVLLWDGLERPRERCRIFVEVTHMIADLIHGHWVLLCLILGDVDVLEMYKIYDNACLTNNQLHSSLSSPGMLVGYLYLSEVSLSGPFTYAVWRMFEFNSHAFNPLVQLLTWNSLEIAIAIWHRALEKVRQHLDLNPLPCFDWTAESESNTKWRIVGLQNGPGRGMVSKYDTKNDKCQSWILDRHF